MGPAVLRVRYSNRPMRRFRKVSLGSSEVVVERRAGDIVHLRSPHALPAYPRKITEKLDHWAAVAPDRVFLAQRDGGGRWVKFSYAEVRDGARRVAQGLLERNL